MIDGVFAASVAGQVQFVETAALTPADCAAVQQQVRTRVLRWFARAGHLDPADARDMASWDRGGGFSLDASVRIEGSTAPVWSGCCAIALDRPLRSSSSATSQRPRSLSMTSLPHGAR